MNSNPLAATRHGKSTKPLLEAREIVKNFPGVKALDGVAITLRGGEIHALMGENGAGKSTFIKVLTGVQERDGGTIRFDGREIHPRSPREAEAVGISTVYQEINLIPALSIAENVMLGRLPRRWGIIQWAAVRRQASAAVNRVGLDLDVRRELRSCSIAVQQMVAIARALDVRARLLVLDEPTSSLDEREVTALFTLLRQLRDEGLAILFVSHFLEQVYALTDRLTILRNGRFVAEHATRGLPRLELISQMLGRELAPAAEGAMKVSPTRKNKGPPLLDVRGAGRAGALAPLEFELRAGEILGIAGLLGSGRTETARMLFGVAPHDCGTIAVAGEQAALASPREAIRRGLAFCPEDRQAEGIVPNLSVRENLILALQATRGPLRLLPRAEQFTLVEHYVRALGIKTPGPEAPIRNLSGGNQQKVLLARWLTMQPRILILDEPTRGIDVGAQAEIEKLIESLRSKGLSVLFISSELAEVARLSDRVIVLRDRRKIGELDGAVTESKILHLIAAAHE